MSIPSTIGLATPHIIPYEDSSAYFITRTFSASGQIRTWDFSGVMPSGAVAAIIRAFGHFGTTHAQSPYGQYRVHFLEDVSGTPNFRRNTPCLSGIGYMASGGYLGGDIITHVLLDSNKKFYGYTEVFTTNGATSLGVYIVLLGWYE